MSYDYLLAKAPADLAGASATDENVAAVRMAFAEVFSGEPIGTLEKVKAALQELVPSLRWRRQKFEIAPHLLVAELGDWSWSTEGQPGIPEFSLGADSGGQVRIVSAARLDRGEVERIARALELMVLDEQTLEILTG